MVVGCIFSRRHHHSKLFTTRFREPLTVFFLLFRRESRCGKFCYNSYRGALPVFILLHDLELMSSTGALF